MYLYTYMLSLIHSSYACNIKFILYLARTSPTYCKKQPSFPRMPNSPSNPFPRCIPKSVDPCSLRLCEQACEVREEWLWCSCHAGFAFHQENYLRKQQPYCVGTHFVDKLKFLSSSTRRTILENNSLVVLVRTL